jgi:hypothetical protein
MANAAGQNLTDGQRRALKPGTFVQVTGDGLIPDGVWPVGNGTYRCGLHCAAPCKCCGDHNTYGVDTDSHVRLARAPKHITLIGVRSDGYPFTLRRGKAKTHLEAGCQSFTSFREARKHWEHRAGTALGRETDKLLDKAERIAREKGWLKPVARRAKPKSKPKTVAKTRAVRRRAA